MIDAIIIDTSALEALQFDFMGITSEVLPAFYDLIKESGIVLLNHPILSGEIKKHISDSDLAKRPAELQKSFVRNKAVLSLVGISPEETIERLQSLSLENKLLAAYEEKYEKSVMLGFPSPQKVFEDYFATRPPFAKVGNKKSEFPDAFVLAAVKDYVKANPLKSVLVISNDGDWESAVADVGRVSCAKTIEEGIKSIRSSEVILPAFRSAETDIKRDIVWAAEGELFEFEYYEPVDDIEINTVRVSRLYDDIVLLRLNHDSALIKCSVELSVDGSAIVVDEGGTIYDPEDGTLLFTSYISATFKNAPAEVECELYMRFDPNDPEGTVEIEKTKLNCPYAIELNLDQADVEWSALSPEEDALAEMMDTLEDGHRH